ncbi:MAG TPA: FtsX-like permease family protein [Solirubrobacterales bacterium]|nr:FtsX-like permease family protein [Solirubrobacterales bacterium]
MSLFAGTRLVARSLLRSFCSHRFRAVAAIFAGAMCIALTTGVRVVAVSVERAIAGPNLSSVTDAEWVVTSRSASGMEIDTLRRMQAAAPDASLAPVLLANTHLAGPGHEPIVVAGVSGETWFFLPLQQRIALMKAAGAANPVLVSRSWAEARGIEAGSKLAVETPHGRASWRVTRLVPGPFPNRGAFVIAPFSLVAGTFERREVADLILALGSGRPGRLRSALERSAGPTAAVVPPDEVLRSYSNSFAPTRNLLDIFVAIAVFAAGGILFFSWRLTLEDARESLARLRLCGARTAQIALASALVLGGVFVLSALIGGPLGILLGHSLANFSRTLVALTQLAAAPGTPIAEPLAGAVGVSALIFLAALAVSVVSIRRMPVIEAVAGRRAVAGAGSPRSRLAGAVAALALVLAVAALVLLPEEQRQVALLPLLVLLGAVSLLAPLLVGALIRRRPAFASLAAGREVALNARRTATLLAVFGLAISMAIGLEGAAGSIKSGISRSVEAWTRGDLFVQTAESGANLQEDKLAPAVVGDLGRVRGVESVGTFTYSTVELHDTRVPLWTWGPRGEGDRYTDLRSTEGPSGAALWRALEGAGTIAVASNYARRFETRVGDRLAVPALDGERSLRVVAIVDNLSSPAGMLLVAPGLYRSLTGDERHYQAIVELAPGASAAAVAARIRELLGSRYPRLTVYDRGEIRHRFDDVAGKLVQAFVVFGQIMFLLALLVGGVTLATSLSLRQRSLALTRLVGAPVSVLWGQLLREAVALGLAAWLIAVPVGVGCVYALLAAIAAQSGLLPAVEMPVALIVASLPLAILLSVLALLLASPRRRVPVMVAALAEE